MERPSFRTREPAIDMPGPLLGYIAILLAIHAARSLLSDSTDLRLLLDLGFVPAQWSTALGYANAADILRDLAGSTDGSAWEEARLALARYLLEGTGLRVWSAVTHAFLHGSWIHVGLNVVWLAAFGTPVVRRLGAVRSVLLGLVSAVAGAFAYWLADPASVQVLIGASGVVSGFMGAAALFVFSRGAGTAATLRAMFRNSQALIFIGLWLVFNLFSGFFAGPLGVEGGIAWQAHIGGLLGGMLAFRMLDPGVDRPSFDLAA